MAQAALQGGIAVQRAEIAQQLAGAGEQHSVTVDHCLMGDVLRKHRLADAVRADKHDDQRINGGAVAVLPVQFPGSTSLFMRGTFWGSRDEGWAGAEDGVAGDAGCRTGGTVKLSGSGSETRGKNPHKPTRDESGS